MNRPETIFLDGETLDVARTIYADEANGVVDMLVTELRADGERYLVVCPDGSPAIERRYGVVVIIPQGRTLN